MQKNILRSIDVFLPGVGLPVTSYRTLKATAVKEKGPGSGLEKTYFKKYSARVAHFPDDFLI